MRLPCVRAIPLWTLGIFTAACSGGGGTSSVLPALQSDTPTYPTAPLADARDYRAAGFAARLLPANFVPSAVMRNGRIPGSLGNNAALYDRGHVVTLGTLDGERAKALFANDRDEAVGWISTSPEGSRAVLFSRQAIRDLGHLPNESYGQTYIYNEATAISDTGEIYGTSDFPANLGFPTTVKFSQNHAPVQLRSADGQNGIGFVQDVNRWGAFAFPRSYGDAPVGPRPALGFGIVFNFLGTRAGGATAINDRGDVAGYIDPVNEPFTAPPGYVQDWKAFIKTSTSLTILPYLPGAATMESTGLNNRGEVVGPAGCQWSELTCPGRVFVYMHGKLFDAANLLPSIFSTPVSLLPGLSDAGQFIVSKDNNYYLVGPARDGM